MSSVPRSSIAAAVIATALAALAVTGLRAASADDSTVRAVVGEDFYSRTNVSKCLEHLPGFCYMPTLTVNCRVGDEVVGGTGWAVSPTDAIVNLAAVDMVDHPYRSRGWRVTNPESEYFTGWSIRVRVYCANTG